jgi:UDP-GlcNAc:undecaprenyl-phosphate GlcNAc-1-phosphate transferase
MNISEIYKTLAIIFLTLFSVSFFFTPIFTYLFEKWRFIDLPKFLRANDDDTKSRRIHFKTYIRSGGITILCTILIGIFFWGRDIPSIGIIIFAMLVLSVVGLIDDKFDISAKYQLLMQFVVSSIVVLGGINILHLEIGVPGTLSLNYFTFPLFLGLNLTIPADIIAIVWLMIMMNAMNWIDGIDGLSTGVTAIMAGTLTLLAVKLGNIQAAILSTILLGSTAGYLPYNFPPAKNTLVGSLGANLFGLILGIMTIMGPSKMAGAIIILIVPVVDMLWVLIGRVNRHQVLNPFKLLKISDKTHLHHRLLDLGLTVRQVVLTEYFLVAAVSTFSLYIFGSNRAFLFGVGVLVVVGFFLVLKIYFHTMVVRQVEIDENNIWVFRELFNDAELENVVLLYVSNNLVGYYQIVENKIKIEYLKTKTSDCRKTLEFVIKSTREKKLKEIQFFVDLDHMHCLDEYLLGHGFRREDNIFIDNTL